MNACINYVIYDKMQKKNNFKNMIGRYHYLPHNHQLIHKYLLHFLKKIVTI